MKLTFYRTLHTLVKILRASSYSRSYFYIVKHHIYRIPIEHTISRCVTVKSSLICELRLKIRSKQSSFVHFQTHRNRFTCHLCAKICRQNNSLLNHKDRQGRIFWHEHVIFYESRNVRSLNSSLSYYCHRYWNCEIRTKAKKTKNRTATETN